MLQVVQNLRDGSTEVVSAPDPVVQPRTVLIRSTASLVSAGTERALVQFGRSGLIAKARQQPDKVRAALERVATDGLVATVAAVRSKLDQPIPLGYSNAGEVIAVGADVERFAVGDRVVSNGPHAGVVRAPENLCARIPDGVTDEAASFAVVASIALQGIRLANPTIGETFAVIGLGLIGQLAVRILRANGCRVIGVDLDDARLELARDCGADVVNARADAPPRVMELTGGRGVDGAIVAVATQDADPMRSAAKMCRKRGRIVLVGVAGLELSRSDFYEKELSFQVSCSYGPGRYDPQYEQEGQDYPLPYVRWTVQRNFEACLDLMASGALDVRPLITHRVRIEDAASAYDLLLKERAALGIVLQYGHELQAQREPVRSVTLSAPRFDGAPGSAVVALIGSGNYASRVLLPAVADAGASLHTLVNTGSVQGVQLARRFGFRCVSTDLDSVLQNEEVDTVFIATRHDSHASIAARALRSGKNVFVEKPLAVTGDDVKVVEEALRHASALKTPPRLMVGFNRRFAPIVARLKAFLGSIGAPPSFVYTVNAGALPPDHWALDPAVGGGRLIGEACHFVDLLRFLASSPIEGLSVCGLVGQDEQGTLSVTLRFANGAIGTVHYFANGHAAFPKERLEVFCGGHIAQIDNFRTLRTYGGGLRGTRGWRQDKGHRQCVRAFLDAIRGAAEAPIPQGEILEVSRAVIEADKQWRARNCGWVQLG